MPTPAETKLLAIFERAPWLRTDGKAVHLSGMDKDHQFTWQELAALVDEVAIYRDALERVVDHRLSTPGLHFETVESLIASATGIAELALNSSSTGDSKP